MGKKVELTAPRRGPARHAQKKKPAEQDKELEEEVFGESGSLHDDQSDSVMEGESDSDDDDSEEEESSEEREIAVKNMKFRERRGTKMNYLINRKKEEEQDPFWAGQGGQLFGDLDEGDEDEEDYVQSSSGRDEFDSDFDQTQSEHEAEQGQEEKEVDEERQLQKKKRREMMRKIHHHVPTPKKSTRQPREDKKPVEVTNRYIHQNFTQDELLGEAAMTQYWNWISLKKLISLETEKKDFTHREHHLEGPKIIYRDRLGQGGRREESYELVETKVKTVADLTRVMHQQ